MFSDLRPTIIEVQDRLKRIFDTPRFRIEVMHAETENPEIYLVVIVKETHKRAEAILDKFGEDWWYEKSREIWHAFSITFERDVQL